MKSCVTLLGRSRFSTSDWQSADSDLINASSVEAEKKTGHCCTENKATLFILSLVLFHRGGATEDTTAKQDLWFRWVLLES